MKLKVLILLLLPTILLAQNNTNFFSSAFVKNSAYITINGDIEFNGGEWINNGEIKFLGNLISSDNLMNFQGYGIFDFSADMQTISGNFHFPSADFQSAQAIEITDSVYIDNWNLNTSVLLSGNALVSAQNFTFGQNASIFTEDNSSVALNLPSGQSFIPLSEGVMLNAEQNTNINIFERNYKPEQIDAQNYLNKFWGLETENNLSSATFYYQDDDVVGDEQQLIPLFINNDNIEQGDQINIDENYISFSNVSSGIFTAASVQPSGIEKNEFNVYSFQNTIYIRCSEPSTVEIYDILGHLIWKSQQVLSKEVSLNQSGIYLVKLKTTKQTAIQKVFVK